ncbi:formamidopyrimidine-DNA glycosylase [Arthrobacter psychrolactophilus]|uniref:DNA-(apurinic or apyrimidinic site) lyase n=1 Tax=Arthrobacter psychrolactophilus TaxID=92442 RepID=A0A2V5INP3_9MICC|nr:DNA glycosylase [Arthrobacter psychrolactophilus]PYI38209.1 formamidopyrimidine-DNA glycosylase [Arthrobacter psychrolactophilus]
MPEGHSVHRLARQFRDVFGGATLAVSSPQGKFAAGAQRLDGQLLERAEAHGKQMFLYFSHDLVMRVHLGLYGAWDFGGDSSFTGASSIGAPRRIGEQEVAGAGPSAEVYAGPPEPKGAVRVRLVSEHGWADLRGPTACEVLTPAEAVVARNKLGPDPLNDYPGDAEEFVRRIRKSSTSIALQLMKQDVLAGVGNVYRAETLFRLGLDPMLSGTSLQGEEAQALWRDIATIMNDGVRDGRIITTEMGDRPSGHGVAVGEKLAEQRANASVPVEDAHYVYKRQSLPCRHCGTEIALQELGGRKLYWCPSCQKS